MDKKALKNNLASLDVLEALTGPQAKHIKPFSLASSEVTSSEQDNPLDRKGNETKRC